MLELVRKVFIPIEPAESRSGVPSKTMTLGLMRRDYVLAASNTEIDDSRQPGLSGENENQGQLGNSRSSSSLFER